MAEHGRGAQPQDSWILPALLIASGIYLYVNLFAWPNIPYLLSGDQIFFWTDAQRMLHGERIYLDFFRFTPPGTDLIYLTAFQIFGPRLWVMNAIVLLLGVSLCWVCFSVSRLLMGPGLSVLAALLFLVFIYCRLLNATHHWFSLMAAMCAARVLMPRITRRRIAAAGFLMAVASFFTQTAGVMGAIAIILWLSWDGIRKNEAWRAILRSGIPLAGTFTVTCSVLNLYYVIKVGWKRLWDLQVIYPHYQAYWFGRLFPGLPDPLILQNLPHLSSYLLVYGLLIVIYPFVLWDCWRKRRNPLSSQEDRLVLICLVGAMLLLEMLPAVNWLRVYSVSMPGVILLVWTASRLRISKAWLVAAGYLFAACAAVPQTVSKHRQEGYITQLPAGETLLSEQKHELYSWIMEHTRPGDFFLSAAWPGVYFPLSLRSPIYAEMLLNSNWTLPEYVGLAVEEVDRKEVKYILWPRRLDGPDDPSRPWEDHLGPFRAYLGSHYRVVKTFSDGDQIWQRN